MSIADRLYNCVMVPFDKDFAVDEAAYRREIRFFLNEPRFVRKGGLCINPAAGEIYFLTAAEKRRLLEIALEEAHGKLPLLCGTWAPTTKEVVEMSRTAKALGADGLFVSPPNLMTEFSFSWNADIYPEVWLDQIKAQDRAVDLPMVTHPTGGFAGTNAFGTGLPVGATLKYCREVPNIVGWKMTYSYDGFQTVAKGLRALDRHVAILPAVGGRFHEYKATDMFDGTMTGYWNCALEPMLEHLDAWDRNDIVAAKRLWHGGLFQFQDYVGDPARLHLRYKIALWLRGVIPNPLMRPPVPAPRQAEIDTMFQLMRNLKLDVIDAKETRLAA